MNRIETEKLRAELAERQKIRARISAEKNLKLAAEKAAQKEREKEEKLRQRLARLDSDNKNSQYIIADVAAAPEFTQDVTLIPGEEGYGIQFREAGKEIIVTSLLKLKDGGLNVAEKSGKVHIGDILMALNGESIFGIPVSDVFNMIKDSISSCTFRFRTPTQVPLVENKLVPRSNSKFFTLYAMVIKDRDGLYFQPTTNLDQEIVIHSFIRKPNGDIGPVEASRKIFVNDIIVSINGMNVFKKNFEAIMTLLLNNPHCKLRIKRPIFYTPFIHSTDDLSPRSFQFLRSETNTINGKWGFLYDILVGKGTTGYLCGLRDEYGNLVVSAFGKTPDGQPGPMERS